MTVPRLRWIITVLLLLATILNYIDRLSLSVVITDVRKEFSLSEEDYSQIVSLFLLAYAIMYAGSGYIVDRLGTRKGFLVFMLSWSLAQFLHAFARGKWSLGGCRFLLGMAEPGNFPAAVKAVDEWYPADKRAIGVGVFNAGSALGSAIAVPLAAFLTLHYGWRSTFLFTGSLGFFWLGLWLLFYERPARNRWLSTKKFAALSAEFGRDEGPRDQAIARTPWYRLVQLRQCYVLILARFLTDPVVYFIIFWLPEYLRRERGFSLQMVGKYAWMPFVFADAGYLLGGWLSSHLMQRGWSVSASRKLAMAAGAALLPSAILAPLAPSAGLALTATCLVLFGHAIWIANLMTLPTDLFPSRQVGTVSGFSGMGGAIGGMLASLVTGFVVTRFSFRPIFVIAGLMHPLGVLLIYRLIPRECFLALNVEAATR